MRCGALYMSSLKLGGADVTPEKAGNLQLTFARDAKVLLEGGYSLSWVQPVGQFRWSTHVELAACFIRQAA